MQGMRSFLNKIITTAYPVRRNDNIMVHVPGNIARTASFDAMDNTITKLCRRRSHGIHKTIINVFSIKGLLPCSTY